MNRKLIMIWAVRVILIALILCWMIIIFNFSAADGAESSALSDKITIKVIRLMESDYAKMSEKSREQFFQTVSFVVRKTGHFGEYGILGAIWILLLLSFEKIRNIKKRIIWLTAMGICLVYAVSDEIHQGFVDGRTPKVLDVGIDTLGGLAGAGFILIIWLIVRRKK